MELEYKERFQLNEELSVSNENIALTDEIVNELTKRARNEKLYVTKYNNMIVNKGQYTHNVSKYFNGIDKLKISYTIYRFKDEHEYNLAKYFEIRYYGSCSDYENKTMDLSLIMIGDKIGDNFVSDIMHEVNHLIQNDRGQKKNEELYDIVAERVKNGNYWEKVVGWALYLSFTTEQDAFAAQFYGYLKSNNIDKETLKFDGNNPYTRFNNAFNKVKELHVDDSKLKKSFGLTKKQLFSRLNAADRRLFKKMTNAWTRHVYECTHKTIKNVVDINSMTRKMKLFDMGITEEVNDVAF